MLAPYRAVLRVQPTRLPLTGSLVGRLPLGMVSLAIVLTVRASAGSYATAGLVTAAHSVGVGVFAPVLGRLADRFGQTRVLVPCAVGYTALLTTLVAVVDTAGTPGLVAVAAVAGAFFPPLSACMRVLWSSLLTAGPLRESAFALDTVVVELAFILGPLLVAATVAVVGPAAGLLLAAGLSLFGTLLFAASAASRAWVPGRQPEGRSGALGSPGIRTVIGTFAATSIAFGVLEVAVPALTEALESPAAAAPAFAAFAGGSLLGGLLYGSRPWAGRVERRYLGLLLALAVGFALLPLATGVPALITVMAVAGLALAPAAICAFRLIDELAPAGAATEAYTWTTTANVAGTAVGAVLAGNVVEAAGARQALAIAAVAVGVAVAGGWLARRSLAVPSAEPAPAPA